MPRERNIAILSKRGYMLDQPSPGLPWVFRIAQEHWSPEFFNPRRSWNSRLIAYIQDGIMAVRAGSNPIEGGPGSVVYIALEYPITEMSVASERGLRLIIIVVREAEGCAVVSNCLGDHTRLFSPGDCSGVEALFLCMLNAASKGDSASTDITANLLLPMLQTIRQEHARAKAADDPRRQLFNRCRDFISHDYLAIENVASVASRFAISHAWLCRLFKLYEGCSPHDFLLQRKMTYALYELHQHDRSVSEVAYELGFADPYSFSKAFKRVLGYSPSQARSPSLR